jgi:acyl-CoA synthetase (AMP-forming)/AMP-acid ligase II
LTHHNILNNGFFVGERLQYTSADRICLPVPFYHCFGCVLGSLAALTHGSAIVLPSESFEAQACLAGIQEERCTFALRCADNVHRPTRSSGVFHLPARFTQDRNNGRSAMSG